MIDLIIFDGSVSADRALRDLSAEFNGRCLSFRVVDWGADEFAVVYADSDFTQGCAMIAVARFMETAVENLFQVSPAELSILKDLSVDEFDSLGGLTYI